MNGGLVEQIENLISKYPNLSSSAIGDEYIVHGNLEFNAKNPINNVQILDDYDMKIVIPNTYPDSLPKVFETAGKIDQKKYDHYMPDKSLCLGINTEIHERLTENATLIFFVETFVIDYLYEYSYFKKYGIRIFGERSHGKEGILQFYREKFKVESESEILSILEYICLKPYRGHINCPCGSGKIIRNCDHSNVLLQCIKSNLKKQYLRDLKILKNGR